MVTTDEENLTSRQTDMQLGILIVILHFHVYMFIYRLSHICKIYLFMHLWISIYSYILI